MNGRDKIHGDHQPITAKEFPAIAGDLSGTHKNINGRAGPFSGDLKNMFDGNGLRDRNQNRTVLILGIQNVHDLISLVGYEVTKKGIKNGKKIDGSYQGIRTARSIIAREVTRRLENIDSHNNKVLPKITGYIFKGNVNLQLYSPPGGYSR